MVDEIIKIHRVDGSTEEIPCTATKDGPVIRINHVPPVGLHKGDWIEWPPIKREASDG